MNNNAKFKEYRLQYPEFIFERFTIDEDIDNLTITYYFNIPGLTEFTPKIIIPKLPLNQDNINNKFMEYLVFHVGLVELISYWKCCCSPHVIIKAGYLNQAQIDWFKKLYYYGQGEFFYVNNIDANIDDFMDITCEVKEIEYNYLNYQGIGNLIPIGGGKDSVVSMELLKPEKLNNSCFIINPKPVMIECANIGGYDETNIIGIKRILDKRLIELNTKGYLNGHTPFSALVAFLSYLTAYLSNRKHIILSNEGSANEATVIGTKINHQYSKTYEFENDFNNYTKKYFKINIKYFSLLRPLSEFQIGMLFSKFEQYHTTFKSCNVGSKGETWQWCCNCPKCLFVYIILSPFLYKEKLVKIFGEDLYEKETLLNTFLELIGDAKTKPFECVGTIAEVRYALTMIINKYEHELPYLLKYYKDNYDLSNLNEKLELQYNDENNLDEQFEKIVKEALANHV